jgi:hypothetical protein
LAAVSRVFGFKSCWWADDRIEWFREVRGLAGFGAALGLFNPVFRSNIAAMPTLGERPNETKRIQGYLEGRALGRIFRTSGGLSKCIRSGGCAEFLHILECASFHSASPPELALRAAAMLDRKTGLNNPSAALHPDQSSHFTKPFDAVVRPPTALEPKDLRNQRQALRSR